MSLLKQKKNLEHQLKELHGKLIDSEEFLYKDGKRLTEKLENRVIV